MLDVQADDSWVDHSVDEIVDNAVNSNVDAASRNEDDDDDDDEDDVPTGGPLDNQVVADEPAEQDENEQGARF